MRPIAVRRVAALLFALSLIVATQLCAADGLDWSLRAGEEPAPTDKPWDQGARITYKDTNGKAATLIDAVLDANYTWLSRRGPTPESGSFSTTVSLGPYLHKDSSTVQNDRGVSLGASVHLVPGGSGSGAVMDYDFGANVSAGKTLTSGTGDSVDQTFDVTKNRETVFAAVYWQPGEGAFVPGARHPNYYMKAAATAYNDDQSGGQASQGNGRISGVMVSGQLSIAPLGLTPTQIGNFVVSPLLTLKAQIQDDQSATGGRSKEVRRLYSAIFSWPFTNNSKEYARPVPSIDFQRSVGADLLQGRKYKAESRINFTLKF